LRCPRSIICRDRTALAALSGHDRILAEEGGDAYSRYNALLRELDSFAAALERRNGKARRFGMG